MLRLSMTFDTSTIGFQEYVRLSLTSSISNQLHRQRLYHTSDPLTENPEEFKKIIERNSSLRVDFGWAMESSHHFKIIIKQILDEIIPKFSEHTGLMTADSTCSWLGFVPHNSYDKEIYKNLNIDELINFNNEMIDFQYAVIECLINHPIYRQHALMRDDSYRFSYFKNIRKDRAALADAYYYYIKAVNEVCLINMVSRDILEEQIGCHYLSHPDLFFELLEFSILKGEIYG